MSQTNVAAIDQLTELQSGILIQEYRFPDCESTHFGQHILTVGVHFLIHRAAAIGGAPSPVCTEKHVRTKFLVDACIFDLQILTLGFGNRGKLPGMTQGIF